MYLTYKGVKQWHIQLGVCLMGIVCSLPFCTNVGHNLSDVIDHYLSNYIMILLGVYQSFAIAWIHQFDETAEKVGWMSHFTYAAGF